MLTRLKRKFIVLATASTLLVMTVLLIILNSVNYVTAIQELDSIANMLFLVDTNVADWKDSGDSQSSQESGKNSLSSENLPDNMSPETPYESRYFAVLVSNSGRIIGSDLSNTISVDRNSMENYVKTALAKSSKKGFVGQFRFLKKTFDDETCIIFLDGGRKLDSVMDFATISVIVGFSTCLVVCIFFVIAAGKIIRPISESYSKQKQFITDAGHEIKTPLTIINANLDILEVDLGEQEEISDIRKQTRRLTTLTNNLVQLSKMEEGGDKIRKENIDLSGLFMDTTNSFEPLLRSKKKILRTKIQPGVTLNCDGEQLRRLTQILMENAIKYSPVNEEIVLSLCEKKKSAVITISNKTGDTVTEEELSHIFDRFYRRDASRNSETGGSGIGLSIAKAITEGHGGTITAYTNDGGDFNIQAIFPY